MTGTVSLAGLILLSACATTSDDNVALADQGVTEEGTEYTCRRIQVTGTRRFERVCTSDAEWDDQARRTQDGVDHIGAADRSPVRPETPSGFGVPNHTGPNR
ncbi:hypothetical protein GCM10017621_19500 [Maricaulis virginensis]|uniref:Uncharacterized protein n=2 Tax=Maricaulis virginensis TaxID=144022 RepID=A0A9W6ILE7_9PROT|nr:hypothetical protein GCM10017621_19500 [Maricaulis virginensis]